MNVETVKYDCAHFKGYVPCEPNKKDNSVCESCTHYESISKRILIIKLGAAGDVIRTTPLIQKYRTRYPHAHITWVTHTPDVLPKDQIDMLYKFDGISIFTLTHQHFDIAINLDKDIEACLLLSKVNASEKFGFTYLDGHIAPVTKNAENKLITGFFDHISKQNTKSYLEEIFEICHLEFNHEEYLIRTNEVLKEKWSNIVLEKASGRKVIGLNTGCGNRWKTRLWPEEHWLKLIQDLQTVGYFCILLGGENEHDKNSQYAEKTGVFYPGYYSLEEFIALSDTCHTIVTQVTLMMHIAIALKKQLVLFNNIFNVHEFELYGRGVILQPHLGCDCYYGNTCKRQTSCMESIYVEDVFKAIQNVSEV